SGPISGILAMSQLAEKSPERTWQMTESLSAFIQYMAPRHAASPNSEELRAIYPPCEARNQKNTEDHSHKLALPLYQRAPAIQMALNALAYRTRQNETRENVPARMLPQLDGANPQFDPNKREGHEWARRYINLAWYRK